MAELSKAQVSLKDRIIEVLEMDENGTAILDKKETQSLLPDTLSIEDYQAAQEFNKDFPVAAAQAVLEKGMDFMSSNEKVTEVAGSFQLSDFHDVEVSVVKEAEEVKVFAGSSVRLENFEAVTAAAAAFALEEA